MTLVKLSAAHKADLKRHGLLWDRGSDHETGEVVRSVTATVLLVKFPSAMRYIHRLNLEKVSQ